MAGRRGPSVSPEEAQQLRVLLQRARDAGFGRDDIAKAKGLGANAISSFIHNEDRSMTRHNYDRMMKWLNANLGAGEPAAHKEEVSRDGISIEEVTAYLFGRIEAQIEGVAGRTGIPQSTIAQRISRLLGHKARGGLLGS